MDEDESYGGPDLYLGIEANEMDYELDADPERTSTSTSPRIGYAVFRELMQGNPLHYTPSTCTEASP